MAAKGLDASDKVLPQAIALRVVQTLRMRAKRRKIDGSLTRPISTSSGVLAIERSIYLPSDCQRANLLVESTDEFLGISEAGIMSAVNRDKYLTVRPDLVEICLCNSRGRYTIFTPLD